MLSLPEVDKFFEELDKNFQRPLQILITGAVAGSIMGNIRPSDDIDFEIQLPLSESGKDSGAGEALQRAINLTSKSLNIPAQYTENIEGWSQISLLDYKARALPYKKIGMINVKFLAPTYWAIGKFTRYLPLDRKDLASVLKLNETSANDLVDLLAKALAASPLSDRSREFKNHVMDFLENEGRRIWGADFNSKKMIEKFKKGAGMA